MSAFGLDKHYFLDLQFLNEQYSIVFGLIYVIAFFFVGGFIPTIISTVVGLIITILLQRFIINPRQSLPSKSVVVISGCSSGIGKYSASKFAEKGFTVFATVRKEDDGKILLASVPSGQKGTIIPLVVDVTNSDQITKAADTVKQYLIKNKMPLSAVINNAGYSESVFLELATQQQIQNQYATNVLGVIKFTNAFLPLLREFSLKKLNPKLQSSVIIVSSAMTKTTLPQYGLYASSKFTLEALIDSYRQELTLLGVNVVSVIPGSILTRFIANTKREVIEKGDNPVTDEELKMHYYADGQDFLIQQEAQSHHMASEPHVVTDIFFEIIASPRPLVRYNAGRDAHVMGLIAKLPPSIITLFPVFKKFDSYLGERKMLPRKAVEFKSTTTSTTTQPTMDKAPAPIVTAAAAPKIQEKIAPKVEEKVEQVPKPIVEDEVKPVDEVKIVNESEKVVETPATTLETTPQGSQPGEQLIRHE